MKKMNEKKKNRGCVCERERDLLMKKRTNSSKKNSEFKCILVKLRCN